MTKNKYIARVERDMEEIVPFFMEDSQEEIAGLTAALESRDYESLKSFGHKIKGSSVTCSEGFREMSDIGLAIETAARAFEPMEKLKELVNRYIDYVNNVQIEYYDE